MVRWLLALLLTGGTTMASAEPHPDPSLPAWNSVTGTGIIADVTWKPATRVVFYGVDQAEPPFLVIHLDTKTIEWRGDQADAIKMFWKAAEQAWPVCPR